MNNDCNLIRDLLPLYAEDMVSPESAALVEAHLHTCTACAQELHEIQAGVLPATGQEKEDLQHFKNLKHKMELRWQGFAAVLMMAGILFGLGLTNGGNLFYNALIMPVVGILGYMIFRWRAVYIMPIVFFVTHGLLNLFNFLRGAEFLDVPSFLLWTLIYFIFISIGVLIAFLAHLAFKKGKKAVVRIISAVLAVALVAGTVWFSVGLVGDPFSKLAAKKKAEQYVAEHFANTDYAVTGVAYDFKCGNYYAYVESPSQPYGDFTVTVAGKNLRDDYDFRVLEHENLWLELDKEYRALSDRVFESTLFPFRSDIAFAELQPKGADYVLSPDAVSMQEMQNDRFYSVYELAQTNGVLILYVDDDTVTFERAAEVLLKTEEICRRAGLPFYSVNFTLQYPRTDETQPRPAGEVRVDGLLHSQITEPDLAQTLRTMQKAQEEKAQEEKEIGY